MKISMIMGLGPNNELGVGNELCYNSLADLKWFKFLTTGNIVIMGYKTWLSLNKKPLPNRTNIVLKKKGHEHDEVTKEDGVNFIYIMETDTAEDVLFRIYRNFDCCYHDIFIIGGANTYKLFENEVNQVYITRFKQPCDKATVYYEPKLEGYRKIEYPIEFFSETVQEEIEGFYRYYKQRLK